MCLIHIIGSRRPSILPVPDMLTSSNISTSFDDNNDMADNLSCDGSNEDELGDDVTWHSPSEKIALVNFNLVTSYFENFSILSRCRF